jgi:hypothetical protein
MANGQLAIVCYRASINGVESSKLDFRVLWFASSDPDEVRELIMNKPLERYLNDEGQEVIWELIEVLRIDDFAPTESGEEVSGFITSTQALPEWAEERDDPEGD